MEDTLKRLVGELSLIRVLLPFKNANTTRKLLPQKTAAEI